jgi:DNA repair protein RadC
VAELARDLLREHDDDKEHFWAIFLTSQNHYLLHILVPRGRSRRRWCTRRRCWGPRSERARASLVLVHNHPSGDPMPSREDVRLTRQLADAARLLDLRLHDHVVIGNGTGAWVSLAERGQV